METGEKMEYMPTQPNTIAEGQETAQNPAKDWREYMTSRPDAGFEMGARRFGRVNWLGLTALADREIRRFLVVWTQTLAAPLVTAGLFLAVFSLAIGPARGEVLGVPFIVFLAPGILMMTVIQNSFANTSSSIVIAKVQGNIVDTLMPPLSPAEILLGYLAGGIVRGLLVGAVIALALVLLLGQGIAHPLWLVVFLTLGAAFLGALGIAAGIISNKFDQIAAITNFIVVPLSFLSGTFYSIATLPPVLETLSRLNPVFYLIDGARYGMIGASDASPVLGLVVVIGATLAICSLCWVWLRSGYRLKP